MIPYEVDPSLHSKEPREPVLDDGFSRRKDEDNAPPAASDRIPGETRLPEKSDF